MTEAFETDYYALIDEAQEQGYGPESGQLLDEAFRLAEEYSRPEHALLARYLYTFAVAPMEPEQALVAFAWCLGHEEHCGMLVPKRAVIELYSIVTGILRSYPQYSLNQIETTFDQMEDRYRELGLPLRDVLHCRLYGKLGIGDRDSAREIFPKWLEAPRGDRNCPVCDRSTRVLYHVYLEENVLALRNAQPILDGIVKCEDGQPMITQCASLVPLLRERRDLEAAHHYKDSSRQLESVGFAGIWSAGRQLFYLSLMGDLEGAEKNVRRFFPISSERGTPTDRFGYWIACRAFLRRVISEGYDLESTIRVLAPTHTVESFEQKFDSEIRELSSRFDVRNENGEYTRIAEAYVSLFESLKRPVP